jgi:hypothetical protein
MLIGQIIESIQEKSLKYMVDPFFDTTQYYLVKLSKQFGKKITFLKLYFYFIMVKSNKTNFKNYNNQLI